MKTIVAVAALSLSGLASAAGVQHVVHFRQGTHAAQYSGTVRGYQYDRYTFAGRAGQKLNVSLNTPKLDAVLNGRALRDMTDVTDSTLVLPANGTYELRILQSRAAARRGHVEPYKVTIDIR